MEIVLGTMGGIAQIFAVYYIWKRYNCTFFQKQNYKSSMTALTLFVLFSSFNVILFRQLKENIELVGLFNQMMVLTLLAAIGGIDLQKMIIPNKLLLLGMGLRGLILLLQFFMAPESLKEEFFFSVAGFLFGLFFMLVLSFFSHKGIGYGDVKLFSWLGFSLGLADVYSILFYSSIVAAIVGIYLLLLKKMDKKTKIPFGPFVLVGTYLVFWLKGV